MTETQTVDLAAWLTRIWDREEQSAREDLEYAGDWDFTRPFNERLLARIAADRKILELHGVEWRQRPDHEIGDSDDPWCGTCLDEDYPCATLRLLASPYKGREGWQEEWE